MSFQFDKPKPKVKDTALLKKILENEKPGILNWMLDDLVLPPVLPPSSPPAPRKSCSWLFIVLSLARAALLGFLLVVGPVLYLF